MKLRSKSPVFSPNTGKYGPEKTPYLGTFHVVPITTTSLGHFQHSLGLNRAPYLPVWFPTLPFTRRHAFSSVLLLWHLNPYPALSLSGTLQSSLPSGMKLNPFSKKKKPIPRFFVTMASNYSPSIIPLWDSLQIPVFQYGNQTFL